MALARQRAAAEAANSNAVTPSTRWEYKWPSSNDVHGPMTSPNMAEWAAAGYFKADGVMIRVAGVADGWKPAREQIPLFTGNGPASANATGRVTSAPTAATSSSSSSSSSLSSNSNSHANT
jgi:hypothetical protein